MPYTSPQGLNITTLPYCHKCGRSPVLTGQEDSTTRVWHIKIKCHGVTHGRTLTQVAVMAYPWMPDEMAGHLWAEVCGDQAAPLSQEQEMKEIAPSMWAFPGVTPQQRAAMEQHVKDHNAPHSGLQHKAELEALRKRIEALEAAEIKAEKAEKDREAAGKLVVVRKITKLK